MDGLFHFKEARRDHVAVAEWKADHQHNLGLLAARWFGTMRDCGDDVYEVMHDGYPTACLTDAAFAYVGVFKAHVNVGFFRGADLHDPHQLLEGTGKNMRHVKLKPDQEVNEPALQALIQAAYTDMQYRLEGN